MPTALAHDGTPTVQDATASDLLDQSVWVRRAGELLAAGEIERAATILDSVTDQLLSIQTRIAQVRGNWAPSIGEQSSPITP